MQLIVDSLYDEIPFIALLTDFENSSRMLESSVTRMHKEKKLTVVLRILFEYIARTFPKLQKLFSVSSEAQYISVQLKSIEKLITCDPAFLLK